MLSRYLPGISARWRRGFDTRDQSPLFPEHQESSSETASMGCFKSWPMALVGLLMGTETVAFNAPPSVPAWCGKPYMSTNSALDPGGQFQFPQQQADPLLYITLQPRYSIYLESDVSGSFIVDATISHIFGESYQNVSYDTPGQEAGNPFMTLDYEIFSEETGELLVSNSVAVNSTGNLIGFSFSSLPARTEPYAISIYGTSPDGQQNYTASTQIYILPSRTYGSAVKIDNLYGGLYVQNAYNNYTDWYALFPNGYYADGSIVTPSNTFNLSGLNTYAAQGFNFLNIVPDGGTPDQSYGTNLDLYWDRMDELNLFNAYDMRFAFQNSTRITDQVEMWKNRSTLLMWYTADEPDGWMYALNSTKLAYDQIKLLDPYHPVSLVLNCQNFFYADYASGADIIYEDAYPVAINATYSVEWNTPCNLTYGDCGCDNCVGELTDVSSRLDDIQTYQMNLEGGVRKPTWSVIQAFGEQEYWKSIPSVAEVENMMMLSVNHDVKGLTYWIYPSTTSVNIGSGALGKVLASNTSTTFLFGTHAVKSLPTSGEALIDASAWIVGSEMMIGIASGEYIDYEGIVEVTLPVKAKGVVSVLYGDEGWTVSEDGMSLSKTGLGALEVGLVVLGLS